MKKLILEAIVFCAIILVVSYSFAQTWWQTSARAAYVAVSADGRKIVAYNSTAPSVYSTNAGVTWSTNGLIYSLSVASSADGTRLLASQLTYNSKHGVVISTNSGATWIQTPLPDDDRSCTCSPDGSTLAVSGDELIFVSTNAGASWQTNNLPASDIWSLASSATGTRLVAAAYYSGTMYFSTNRGQTWSPTGAPTSGYSWHSVACSADGKHVAATGFAGTVISSNSGESWISSDIRGYRVACSADGSKWIIGGDTDYPSSNDFIYTSIDFGMSWTSTNIPGLGCWSVASSADGSELAAGGVSRLWLWQATPHPQIVPLRSATNLNLSWTLPSTNFVLQQNADLTTANWTDVPNAPVLNFTDLQYQATLPLAGGSGFYRLQTK